MFCIINMERDQFVFSLETHQTKDVVDDHVNGNLTVVWRDWDKIINDPKMVYISSVEAGETKGPHIHLKRNSYFLCIRGNVVFIIRNENGEYIEIESSEKKPEIIFVPKNYASAHINLNSNRSQILTLADIAWKPNDNEMKNISFEDYDWEKWNSLSKTEN